MENQMISIKIEGEDEQVLQFSIPEGDAFGSSVNGFLGDEHHQFAGTEEIASLLGNPSSESLTMYKCEPMEQDDDIGQTITLTAAEGSHLDGHSGSGGVLLGQVLTTASRPGSTPNPPMEDNGDSSSSSSNSDDDDDNSSASDGDNDSSAEEECRNGVADSECSRELSPRQNQRDVRDDGNEKIIQQFNRRKRFKSKSELTKIGIKVEEAEAEKTLEHFVQDNIEEYLTRHGFRDAKTVPTTVPKGIFASIILPEAARSNTIAYGPNYDAHEVLEEIEGFWEFYVNQKEKFPQHSTELKPVLTPMLLHFFNDCSSKGIFKIATKLYTTFAKRFYQEDRSQDALNILTNLSGIINTGTFMSSEFLQTIRQREHCFLFSESLFQKLKRFLVQRQSPVLTHLFTSKFVVQIRETADVIESLLEGPPSALDAITKEIEQEASSIITKNSVAYSSFPEKQNRTKSLPTPPQSCSGFLFDKAEAAKRSQKTGNVNESTRISSTRKAIYRLRNSVEANIPSIQLQTLSGRPICAAISAQGTMFAFGMPTSAINVCFSTPRDLQRFNMEKKLECDYLNVGGNQRKRSFNGAACFSNASPRSSFSVVDSDEEVENEVKMINSMFGHEGAVYDLKFHPKTRLLFSVGHDSTLRAWDLSTMTCRCVYRGHTSPIWCMDITDTGHMIVTGSMDTTARIWLPEKTEFVRLLAGHYFDVDCVKFHPNEAYVATGSVDKSVRLWAVADGNLVRVFTGSTSGLSAIAFHDSGKYIIGGCEDSFIRIWDIAEGETLAELPSPLGSASSCRRIALCQNMLAAGFEDNTVRIWNLRELFGGNNRLSLGACESSSSDTDEEILLETKAVKMESHPHDMKPGTKEETDSDSCSITEDELEPLETGLPSTAVRLPAPKIVACDSSSILSLYYQDFGHLFVLGSKIESSDFSAPGGTSLENEHTGSSKSTNTLPPPIEQEAEPGVAYLPESMRPALIAAGINRWPIPVERLTSSDDEEEPLDGAAATRAK